MPGQLATVCEAARDLEKSEATIRKWADSGRLPVAARLADGTRLFRREDIDAARTPR
jgi:excisionase family DNA binding protein